MFDDVFWELLGAEKLSEKQKERFTAEAKEELEIRVGEALSRGLSERQVDEFEELIDGSAQENDAWLRQTFPDYRNSALFKKLKDMGYSGDALINEVASVLWLRENRPDYSEIVSRCTQELREEILANRELILCGENK